MSYSLILHNKPFPTVCDVQQKVDYTWQPATTSSVAEQRSSSKALSKAKLAPKKGHGHWWSAASLIHYSFLNPSETITSEKYVQQMGKMNWKVQRLQPALVNRMGPILLHDNAQPNVTRTTLQRLNKLGYKVLPHLPYSPDLSPTDNHFFKHLNNILQGKCFHNQQDAGNAFQEFIESEGTDFYVTGISVLFSRWQKCVDCNGSYFD